MNTKPQLTFASGVGTVTGANFLLDAKGKKILVDCGVVQGTKEQDLLNYNDFPYDPSEVDVLIVTHAHLDHIGRIGKLVRDGFNGVIYSTIPTKQIAGVMMEDSVDLMADQAERLGKNPMYSKEDIAKALDSWEALEYHTSVRIEDGLHFKLYDAGHILGSAQIMMFIDDTRVLFTGDLGNSPSPLLRDTEHPAEEPHYIITESVYGDRNHEHRDDRIKELERVMRESIERGGVLIIPAFSVERTQELLYEMNDMVEAGRIPRVPIYVDSPLGIDVTRIYAQSVRYLKDEVQERAKTDDVFDFPGLKFAYSTDESKAINHVPAPKIIMAGSGMSVGGRVLHHEKMYASDPNATILLVGYQSPGTLGRAIQDRREVLHIFGEEIPLRARVEMISGFSGHKDSDHLQEYLTAIGGSAKKIFCAMGETGSAQFLATRLRDWHGLPADVPELGETVELD